MLQEVIKRLVGESLVRYIVFEGKQDLDKKLNKKIKNYNSPHAKFIILRDQDRADCKKVKGNIVEKIPKSKKKYSTVRIACRELESFYLGELTAVANAFELPKLHQEQNRSKFKNPDNLANAKQELRKLTNSRYQPIAGSRSIAQHLNLSGENKSKSFNALLKTIKESL